MPSSENTSLRGILLALAAFAVFATHDAIIKHLGGSYAPFQIVFFSVLFGFPMVTFLMMRDASHGNLRPVHPWWTALRTAAVVITATSAFYAFSTLPLAQVYAILFATPLLITVLSIPVLGEVVRLRRWAAVVTGLGGVLIVLRPGAAPLEPGHLAALTAATGAAVAAIVARKIGREERPVVMMLFPLFANIVVMGALLPLVYRPMPGADLAAQAAIAALAFAASLLILLAYRSGEAVTIAPMQYSQIVWASLYGTLFFDERLDAWTVTGAAVIIASGLYILLREGRGSASSHRPVLRTRSRHETGTFPRIGALLRGERDDR